MKFQSYIFSADCSESFQKEDTDWNVDESPALLIMKPNNTYQNDDSGYDSIDSEREEELVDACQYAGIGDMTDNGHEDSVENFDSDYLEYMNMLLSAEAMKRNRQRTKREVERHRREAMNQKYKMLDNLIEVEEIYRDIGFSIERESDLYLLDAESYKTSMLCYSRAASHFQEKEERCKRQADKLVNLLPNPTLKDQAKDKLAEIEDYAKICSRRVFECNLNEKDMHAKYMSSIYMKEMCSRTLDEAVKLTNKLNTYFMQNGNGNNFIVTAAA